jgi:hypothetical protein
MYIQRSTEDPDENMAMVQQEVDLFLDGEKTCGLGQLVDVLYA